MDIVYGRHAVAEALRAEEELLEIHVAEGVDRRGIVSEIVDRAARARIPVKSMPQAALDRTFSSAGGRGSHQGILAVVPSYRYHDLAEILAEAIRQGGDPFVLAIDAVQDVHNLGSLLRTAEAAGVHGVILPDRGAASVTAAVRNASAGAVAHLMVARQDFYAALDELAGRGITLVGLDAHGEASLFDIQLDGPVCLVVGGESRGLRGPVASRCQVRARLPMAGRVDSLNAAAAGSVAIYEAVRQRMPRRS